MSKLSRTVLVIDDSRISADIYGAQFCQDEAADYQILMAHSVDQALQLVRSHAIDCVVFRLHAAEAEDEAHEPVIQRQLAQLKPLLAHPKAASEGRYVPVVVIGDDCVEHAVQALKAGVTDYLVGDRTTPADLCATVSSAIKTTSLATNPTASTLDSTLERSATCPNLVHQQQLIEAIYQSAPIGLAILDRELRYIRINECLATMNGLPVEAHLGRTVRDVLPRLANTIESTLHSVLATGQPCLGMEIRGETLTEPHVTKTWISHFVPVKYGTDIVGISAVCEEVTERVQAAEALRQSESRFRTMADKAPVMVWLADTHGHCTYLSQSWSDFTGQPEDQALGLGWLEWVHPDDRPRVKQVFLDEVEPNPLMRLEYRLLHRDGSYRWV